MQTMKVTMRQDAGIMGGMSFVAEVDFVADSPESAISAGEAMAEYYTVFLQACVNKLEELGQIDDSGES